MNRWFSSAVVKDDCLYWISEIYGDVMKLNLKNSEISYVDLDYSHININMNGGALTCVNNGIIYGFACGGENLLVIDEKNKAIDTFYLGMGKKQLNSFTYACQKGDELCIVPLNTNELIKIKLRTKDVVSDILFEDSIEKGQKISKYYCDDVLKIISCNNSKKYIFDSKLNKIDEIKIPNEIGTVIACQEYCGEMYFLNAQNEIYSWKRENDKILKIVALPKTCEKEFTLILIVNNMIWVFPSYGKDIYKYELSNNKLEKYNDYPEGYKYTGPKEWGKFTRYCYYEKKYYFAMHTANYILYVDEITGECRWLDAKWPTDEETIRQLVKKRTLFVEKDVSLESFLEYIKKAK